MSINRIDVQGAIARTADFSTIKQNEDNKGQVDQTNFQAQFSREIDQKGSTVTETKHTQEQQESFQTILEILNNLYGKGE